MNVQLVRTKAETALSAELADAIDALPGGVAVQRLRKEAVGRFAALGLPHRRIEEWKYTDLRVLLKEAYPVGLPDTADADGGWADGDGSLLDIAGAIEVVFIDDTCVRGAKQKLPRGVTIETLARLLEDEPAWLMERLKGAKSEGAESTLALNTALMAEGAVVRIARGTKVEKPIHLVFKAGRNAPAAVALRNIIVVEDGAEATLVESFDAPASALRQRYGATQVVLGEGAKLAHVTCVETLARSAHIGASLVEIGAEARYQPFQLTVGGGVARYDIRATFAGEEATFDLGAGFLASGQGHVDTTLVVDHAVPRCKSRELVKGVLDGTARGVFQGKVIVRPDAQKTDGKQMAQALMLSPDAEFDSKPELEIHADDVVCGHGSTVAEIDDDLLFYCASRGIPRDEARALLIASFVGEAIDKVESEAVREALRLVALRQLGMNATTAAN